MINPYLEAPVNPYLETSPNPYLEEPSFQSALESDLTSGDPEKISQAQIGIKDRVLSLLGTGLAAGELSKPQELPPGSILDDSTRKVPSISDTTGGGSVAPLAGFKETMAEPVEMLMNPRVTFPRLEIKEGESRPLTYAKEAVNIALGLPEFMSSTVGIGGLVLAPVAPLTVGGVFLADTLHTLGKQIVNNYANWDQMTTTQKDVAVADMVGTGAFSALLGAGVGRGMKARAIEKAPMGIGEPARPKPVIPVSNQDLRKVVTKNEKEEVQEGLQEVAQTGEVTNPDLTTKREPVKSQDVKETKAEPLPESVTDAGLNETVTGEAGPVDALVAEAKSKPTWEQTLEMKHALEKESKRRSMIFQHESKQDYANLLGLKPDSLLDLSYNKWVEIQKDVEAFKDEAGNAFTGDTKTLLGKIWSDYAKANPEKIDAILTKHELKPVTPTPPAKGPEGKQVQAKTVRESLMTGTRTDAVKRAIRDIEDGVSYVADLTPEKARTELDSAKKNWESQLESLREIESGKSEPKDKDYSDWKYDQGKLGKVLTFEDWATQYAIPRAEQMLSQIDRTRSGIEKLEKIQQKRQPTPKPEPDTGAGTEPPLITPEERARLIQEWPKSETVIEMEARDAEYKSRPRKQTGAELQKEWEQQQKAKSTPTPEPVKPQGMGGAVPEEFSEPGSYASNMFAAIDRDRVEMGKEPMELGKKRTWDEDSQKALTKMNREPDWLPTLLSEVALNPRPLLSWENAGLVWYRANLKAEANNAMKRINLAFEDGRIDALNDAKADLNRFESSIQALDDVVGRGGTGSEAGRSLKAQQMATGQDFSLIEMRLEKRAVANEGKPLTPAQEVEVARLYKEIAEKDAALKKYEAEAANRRAGEILDGIKQEPYKSPYSQAVLDHAKKVVEDHKKILKMDKVDALSDFLTNPDFQGMGAATPGEFKSRQIPKDLLDAQAEYWGQRSMEGLDRKGFELEAKTKFGEPIKPYLDQIWEAANKHVDEYLASLTAKLGKDAGQVKQAVKKTDLVEVQNDLLAKIQDKLDSGKRNGITFFVQRLARTFVELGIREREALIDVVHAELVKKDPTFTRRETMDAISGYGEFKPLTKDEVSLRLRDLKGQMQQVGKIEDMTAGKAPSKTGIERRTPSDEERQLIKLVNELKKKGGFTITDPATQLASALTARKTYYRNRMADLKIEIENREKTVKNKQPSPTDLELEAMKAEYKEIKAEHDDIFGSKELTDEQRLKRAITTAERGLKEYERKLKAREVAEPKKFLVKETPELTLARARRDAAKAAWQEFRDLDIEFQRQQEVKALNRQKVKLEQSIADKEKQLAEGPKALEGKPVNRPASDPVLEQLLQRRDILNQRLAESRKKPADVKYKELLDRKLADLNKRITEKETKIASGDLSTRKTPVNRPLNPELEVARQKLEALNKQLQELRNPKKSPEERALQAFKTRKMNEVADYTKRLAEMDFAPRVRTPKFKRDAEAELFEFYAFAAKEAWHKALMKDKLAKAHPIVKAIRFAGETLNTQRAILTSADFSAVLRQGGFITLAHPIRSAQSFPAMFRAFASKSAAHAVTVQIMRRKNYRLYKSSKLYLSEHGQKLSQMEENYMSRWADKIPLVAGSQRAYTTFLNKLRADSFDAMVETLSRTSEPTPKELDAIANYINVSTGRGSLGVKHDAALATAATVFFAPRYVASRFQMLAGQPFYRGTGRTRKMIAQEYARFLIGVGLVYGLGKMAGAAVEEDPRSSEFGKLRWGNTRVDPMAGLLQSTVLIAREGSGAIKQSKSGKIVPIRGDGLPYKGTTGFDVLARFGRSKLAPTVGAGINVLSGSDVTGQPVTIANTATGLLVPLSTQDIYNVMMEQGVPEGTILTLLSMFGMGLQNFDASKHAKPEKAF